MKKILWYSLVMFCLIMTFYSHGGMVADRDVSGGNRLERAFTGVSLQVRESVDYLLDRADLYCTSSIEELEILVERWTRHMDRQKSKGKA
jgi:hypothetical protein